MNSNSQWHGGKWPFIVMLACATPVMAADEGDEKTQEEARKQQEYEQAIARAEQEQQKAQQAVQRAREELQRADRERTTAAESHRDAHQREREAASAAMQERSRELSRVHEELRQASREVARVHREITRPTPALAPRYSINLGDRAVIGVVLGDSNEEGVEILGVSPDGPAERAGVQPGDVIVSVMGTRLASEDDTASDVLREVLREVKPGDELSITVDRKGEAHDLTVVAEKREPFAWQSIVRLPSAPIAPGEPGAPVIVERIEIPRIDEQELSRKLEQMHGEMEGARMIIDQQRSLHFSDGGEYEFEFEEFSELGDAALAETNVWFGMSLTRGLKLAEINPELGEYFKADSGVLVLEANPDNELKLQSGDVVQKVGDTAVRTPVDMMRALRSLKAGEEISIEIKRDRKNRTLGVVIPESRTRFGFAPEAPEVHFEYRTRED